MVKKWVLLCVAFCCVTLWGCSKEPVHQHAFGEWAVVERASCKQAGVEKRTCLECSEEEIRSVEKLPHTYTDDRVCDKCRYVDFDPEEPFVELGNICWYGDGVTANYVWDVKIWNGKVYRGVGDYNKGTAETPFLAYDMATRRWEIAGYAADDAICRFVEIDGTLYAPGIDPREGWEYGNYYVLEGEKWQKKRNLPNGLHNFDMIAFDGKLFAGLGTETVGNTVAVSQDKGESFTFVPLYRDGVLMDTSGYEYSRTYAFVEYSGSLYAFVTFKKMDILEYDRFIFRYEAGNMVYQSAVENRMSGKTGENYWQGKLEWNGVCYLTSTGLHAVTDFSKPETHRQIPMPNGGVVSDILLYNDEMYVLSYTFKENLSCGVVIYKSATGEEGSFTEVAAFHYSGIPISFDFDGEHFYIGIGSSFAEPSKAGMLLRVKPAA